MMSTGMYALSSVGVARRSRSLAPNDEVRTPVALFEHLDAEFGFTLDAAATPESALCEHFYTADDDGLSQPWSGVVWCNPPYSDMLPWARKAYESALHGVTVVMLVPVRSDLAWWHDYALRATEIRYIRKRLRFHGHTTSAPFPSCVVVFRPECEEAVS